MSSRNSHTLYRLPNGREASSVLAVRMSVFRRSLDAALACRRGKRGVALALVLAVLAIVSLIGAGLVGSAGAGRIDAVQREQSLRCFWAAESALATARYRLYTDEAYRAAPAPVSLTNGNIVARANVTRDGNTYSVAVVASNTLNRLARRLYQDFSLVTYDYWDDFALFAGPRGVSMEQSVVVDGSVYSEGSLSMSQSSAIFENLYCQGNLTMSQSAAIYESAFIGGSISLEQNSVIYGNSYPFNSPANPYYVVAPTVPEIDTTYYDALLAEAAVQDSGLNFNNDINLAGQIRYVRGSATLRSHRAITSTPGGGILVVRDSLSVLQGGRIGSDVTVVCGLDFELKQSSRVGTNAVVYAGRDILAEQGGVIAERSALIAGRELEIEQSANIHGMVYAGQELELSQSTHIVGLAFAKQEAELSQSVYLTYSKEALPTPLPPGIVSQAAMQIVPSRWRQM